MKVLVVGGAGGVGSAVVAKLLARGDAVIVTVLNDAEEDIVRAANPGLVAVHRIDLSDAEAACSDLRTAVGEAMLDAVVVCAAISPYGPLESNPIALVRKTFEINVFSHIAIYQAVMPVLRRSQGRIIFTGSMSGRVGLPFIGTYTASKFALEGLADVMRREARGQGVAVSLVEPGGIKTPMVSRQLETLVGDIAALDDEQRSRYGMLYRGFEVMATESHYGSASTPELVADVLLRAIDDPVPAARYIAGPDAEHLIALSETSSDEELDVILSNTFADAASRAE
jgi:NAD(P)-dependent dehydrogenase (short-subunit alcohol dehydrogenase family)